MKKGKCQDTYEMVAEYKEPNYIVKVFRPILTDEEREKRNPVPRQKCETV